MKSDRESPMPVATPAVEAAHHAKIKRIQEVQDIYDKEAMHGKTRGFPRRRRLIGSVVRPFRHALRRRSSRRTTAFCVDSCGIRDRSAEFLSYTQNRETVGNLA
jgi:hypothetical protein